MTIMHLLSKSWSFILDIVYFPGYFSNIIPILDCKDFIKNHQKSLSITTVIHSFFLYYDDEYNKVDFF